MGESKIKKKLANVEALKKDLISACNLFGWDENNEFDSAVHAKNFLEKCKRFEESNFYDFNYFLKNTLIPKIEENKILKATEIAYDRSPLKKVYTSIESYIKYVQSGKSKGLKEYKGQRTLDYADKIMKEINKYIPAF